jgi:hypothetical protein
MNSFVRRANADEPESFVLDSMVRSVENQWSRSHPRVRHLTAGSIPAKRRRRMKHNGPPGPSTHLAAKAKGKSSMCEKPARKSCGQGPKDTVKATPLESQCGHPTCALPPCSRLVPRCEAPRPRREETEHGSGGRTEAASASQVLRGHRGNRTSTEVSAVRESASRSPQPQPEGKSTNGTPKSFWTSVLHGIWECLPAARLRASESP